MGTSLLLYFVIKGGFVNSHEGILFIVLMAAYLFLVIRKSRKDTKLALELMKDADIPEAPSEKLWKDVIFILVGCTGLYFGSEWFVGSAQQLALTAGIEERVVGLTVVAIGTSLPELVTSSVASVKGQTDLA